MSFLDLQTDDGVATITLTDPRGVNALGPDAVAALRTMLGDVAADPSVAVVLLRAEGAMFCAGGDIHWFAEQGEDVHAGIRALAEDAAEAIRLLHEMPKVTIAAVHGAAAGGGLGLALACDVVIAATGTTFVTAYLRLGASPDLGVSAFLVRDLGYRKALELTLLSEPIGADEALGLGLVSRVVARDELDGTARALAARLAAGPRNAHATSKRLLRAASARALAEHLQDEMTSVADLSQEPDWQEGIRAFLEGRAPVFGR